MAMQIGTDLLGLTESELEASFALADLNRRQEEGTLVGEDYVQAVMDLGYSLQESETRTRNLANAQRDLETALDAQAGAFDRLTQAQSGLERAQQQWANGAGNDVVNALDAGWVRGQRYADALAAIDDVYGTGFGIQQQYQEDVAALVREYRNSGDIDTFRQRLQELRDVYEPLDESVNNSRQQVADFRAEWESLQSRVITLTTYIETIEGPPPAGSTEPERTERTRQDQVFATGTGPGGFTVPSGYPGDSYNVGLSSGEHVTVTPPGSSGGSGTSVTLVQNFYGPASPDQVDRAARNGVIGALSESRARGKQ
jgi:hypothetical protein